MPDPTPPGREAVILLHGLGRSRVSMLRLERALRRAGYRTHNETYPSTRRGIAHLAREVVGRRLDVVRGWGVEHVHFVTHSMGGVLVRHFAERVGVPEGTRAVMIAPPHGGSEVAEFLRDWRPARWHFGPALGELGMGEASVPRALGPLRLEAGVIAGGRAWTPLFNRLFEGDYDGLVSIESARAPGVADFAVVPLAHTFIAARPVVIRQALHFLRHGRFLHAPGADALTPGEPAAAGAATQP